MIIKTIMIGDIVGKVGLYKFFSSLSEIKKLYKPDIIVVNGENTNKGFGIIPKEAELIFEQGVDVITSGNHIWQHELLLEQYWKRENKLLRPQNYPSPSPGLGYIILEKKGEKIAVVNLQGRQLMPHFVECPIRSLNQTIKILKQQNVSHIFVDFHAELVLEKEILAYSFDGKITALVGTHTHTHTMDEKILPYGTAYISDLGMVGGIPSIIGNSIPHSLKKAISQIPKRTEEIQKSIKKLLSGIIIQSSNGKTISIQRITNTI